MSETKVAYAVEVEGTAQGRNGTFEINALRLVFIGEDVWISGISSKRGIDLNGGFCIDRAGWDRLQAFKDE
jgi:hypothetical protein